MSLDPTLFAAAALAPAAVWLLWRGQTLSVEALRLGLLWMARRGLRWLYATVSWFGTLLHELSHAAVLLLSGHGISQFRAGVERGHVLPTHAKTRGLGMLSFLAAALAPLFVPPLLVLLALVFLVDSSLLALPAPGPGLQPALGALQEVLLEFPLRLLAALAQLDLARWQHVAALALALLALPGARPSHAKGSRFHGPAEGDVPVLRAHIRRHPVPFLLFLLLLSGAYFLTFLLPEAYWWPLGGAWALALTGIVLALAGAAWWGLVGLAGAVPWLGLLGPAAFVAVQLGARTLEPAPAVPAINLLSLAAWATVGGLLFVVARRR